MGCSAPGCSVYGILQARILEWVAFPFSRGSSQARDWTQVPCTAGRFFTIWGTRKAHCNKRSQHREAPASQQREAPIYCSERKPTHSSEDPEITSQKNSTSPDPDSSIFFLWNLTWYLCFYFLKNPKEEITEFILFKFIIF